MVALVLIAVGFIIGTLFVLPTVLPEIRKRAQQRPRFRNRIRIIVALLTLLILFAGLSWGMSQFHSGFAFCNTTTSIRFDGTVSTIDCDSDEDLPALSYELWVRTMLPPSARETCLFNDTTCDFIAEYQVFTNDNAVNTWSAYWGLIVATLIRGGINWGVISFITQPKQKSVEIA